MDTSPGERSIPEASSRDPAQEFVQIYDNEVGRVYRYISYHVGSVQEAEDLTADVFQRALQSWPSIHGQLNSPRAWLMTVANNLVVDHYRRRAKPAWPLVLGTGSSPSPEEDVVRQEETRTLLERLSQLPERDRTILTLRFAGELSHREIGRAMGISEDASAVALLRALRRLRMAYEGEAR